MKKFLGEFKDFINRGNVMDLAVAVIIGGAFTAIVTALTTNIINPFIFVYRREAALRASSRGWWCRVPKIDFGAFISAITSSLSSWRSSCVVKAVNKRRRAARASS